MKKREKSYLKSTKNKVEKTAKSSEHPIASIQRIPALVTVAPRLSGTLHGLVDACYSCGGFFVPIMCSAMIQGHENEINYWSHVWFTCAAFVAVWGLTYI